MLYCKGTGARSFIKIADITSNPNAMTGHFEKVKMQGFPVTLTESPGEPMNLFILYETQKPYIVAVVTVANESKENAIKFLERFDLKKVLQYLKSY